MDKLDVALGAVIGALAGDAAGATLEFIGRRPSLHEVRQAMSMVGGGVWGTAPGQVTDDGEMTLALAHALAGQTEYNLENAADYYLRWIQSQPFDVGITTRKALGIPVSPSEQDMATKIASAAQSKSLASKANGSLMRLTPLGVWSHRLKPSEAAAAAKSDARLTHPNPACQYAAAAYVVAIRHLVLYPGDADGAFEAAQIVLEGEPGGEVTSWLKDAADNVASPYYPQAGFARIAFTHAFRHLKLRSSYAAAIEETLLGGGDTDTNACIVGGLVGARCGIADIPDSMRQSVLTCDTHLGRPRPDWLSTKHVAARVKLLIQ